MAPISEKRATQQPIQQHQNSALLKESSGMNTTQVASHNGHGHLHRQSNNHHQHAKENTNRGTGIEILDFHESWREEIEMYKNDPKQQHRQHYNKHYLPQLLGTHNHAHTPQGCEFTTTNKCTNGSVEKVATNDQKSINAKRKVISTSVVDNKLKLKADADSIHREDKQISIGGNHNQRTREDPSAGDGKTSHYHIHNAKSSKSHTKHGIKNTHASASTTAAIPPTNHFQSMQTSPKPTNKKIVIKKCHAINLLNNRHLEDKNVLVAPSALAYEPSFYATNYLNRDSQISSNYILNGNSPNASDGNDSKDYYGQDEEDPCAAIDDVKTYSDTDTDEEYVGEPFMLDSDGIETLQSSHMSFHTPSSTHMENTKFGEIQPIKSFYYTPKSILSASLFPNVPPYLNFSSHAERGPPMPTSLHKVLKWKLSPVMPKIVKRVVLNSGFRIIKNTTDWMAVWEKHMKSPGFRTIRSHQKYNHMPGSFRIGRKDTMWKSINLNIHKYGSKEFGFMQKSYVMPEDLEDLRQIWPKTASRNTKWIIKPPASARGTGISIVNKWSQFPKDRPLVVQKYIERPLLINENKFDMRIYVIMTSINPLRLFMYKDGLARFASVKYNSELNNLDDHFMHLTNYSINKFSQNYAKNEDYNACQGHKWTLQSLWTCLEERGVNTKRLWATLRNLVIKAIVSGESGLNRMYRQNVNFRYNCFEMFGFDILLDDNLIPWLLEINISPSLHSELPLDLHVKGPLIQSVLNTALYQVPPKLSEKQQTEISQAYNIEGPLCHDKRIFTTCLRQEEVRKHNQFTNRSIEFREEYLDSILDHLMPDDIRCLIIAEDELHRCSPLERIFPTQDTHKYLKFIENPRYYNRLLDAWEHRYGHCRSTGIQLLRTFCKDKYHLKISDAAMEKEPDIQLTDIDVLHVKKTQDLSAGFHEKSTIPYPDKDTSNAVDDQDKDQKNNSKPANILGTSINNLTDSETAAN